MKRLLMMSLMLLSTVALTQTLTPKAALERLMTTSDLQDDWFSDTVLAQVSTAQISDVIQNLTQQLGAFERVEGDASPFTLVLASGTASAQIVLDTDGKIAGLWFGDYAQNAANLQEAVAAFESFEGNVSVLVIQDGTAVASLNEQNPLAVGSAFKLAVLSALQDQINAGQHSWADTVNLQPGWKSLPSGILQTWPDNAPLTLQTLATLMISQSDNTATDALIDVVGTDAIEAKSPRNQPFLTTQQLFKLKNPANQDLLDAYRAATNDPDAQRNILTSLNEREFPDVSVFSGNPVAPDIEWFFTTSELCDLMQDVADLPFMSVNPGVANPDNWQRVAFKGGSEPGVLNLTSHLTANDGSQYCVSVTLNNPDKPINETQAASLYNGILGTLQ